MAKTIEAFPTGHAAHRKCKICGMRYHVYQFPYRNKKAGVRSDVCLSCTDAAKLARLAVIRPAR